MNKKSSVHAYSVYGAFDVNVEFFQHVLNMHFNQLVLNRAISFNMTVSTEVVKVWRHTTFQGMVINIMVIPAELVDSCIGDYKQNSFLMLQHSVVWLC